jgi:3-dehydroquinate synthase
MQTLEVLCKPKKQSYPLYLGRGVLQQAGKLCRRHIASTPVVFFSDDRVAPLYAQPIEEAFAASPFDLDWLILPAGEEQKRLAVVERIYEQLLERGYRRDLTIVALGGGVVGDLAGFVAATYLRGVSFLQLPTTLLAQVDASIGGKTGVNHRLGKNLIGAFYQPRCVLIDPLVLATLPPEEFLCGMGEVLKYALLDQQLFLRLESELPLLLAGETSLLEEVILHCCQIKARIVSLDEKESALRKVLNLGHTVGHALEAALHYQTLRHGEAVLWGLRATLWLSIQKGLLSTETYERALRLLQGISLAPLPPSLQTDEVLAWTYADKKASEEHLYFVYLEEIGCPLVAETTTDELLAAIAFLLEQQ